MTAVLDELRAHWPSYSIVAVGYVALIAGIAWLMPLALTAPVLFVWAGYLMAHEEPYHEELKDEVTP